MKFCVNGGAKLETESRFCRSCGIPIDSTPHQPSEIHIFTREDQNYHHAENQLPLGGTCSFPEHEPVKIKFVSHAINLLKNTPGENVSGYVAVAIIFMISFGFLVSLISGSVFSMIFVSNNGMGS